MNNAQAKLIRDNSQAILDLAESRLRDEATWNVNIRHDLKEIVGLARAMLLTVGVKTQWANCTACSEARTKFLDWLRAQWGINDALSTDDFKARILATLDHGMKMGRARDRYRDALKLLAAQVQENGCPGCGSVVKHQEECWLDALLNEECA